MSKLIRRWLTDDLLRTEFSGLYLGTIADVSIMSLNHKFKGAKVDEPTIRFADDLLLVPNQRMRRDLIALFGAETDDWRGQRIRIRRQGISHTDKRTGEVRLRFEKRAEDPDSETPRQLSEPESDFTDMESSADAIPFRRVGR